MNMRLDPKETHTFQRRKRKVFQRFVSIQADEYWENYFDSIEKKEQLT